MNIQRMNDAQLLREYQELRKAGFNSIFGRNAREACNECVDELHKRGIKTEPNIFGDMPIKKWTY